MRSVLMLTLVALLVTVLPAGPAAAAFPAWTRTFGTELADDTRSAAVAPDRGVVVASLERSGDPLHRELDRAVLRRYRADGSLAWKRSIGADDTLESLSSVTVTESAIFWTGGVHRDAPDDDRPYFVRKLGLDGTIRWTRWLPGLAVAQPRITTRVGDPIVAYGDGLYGPGLFVARLDTADGHTVAGPWDTGLASAAAGVAADASGIYVLSRAPVFQPVDGLALVKLDHAGERLWSRVAPGSRGTSDVGWGLVLDGDGVVATYQRYRDATGHDTGVVAYTSSGGLRWRESFSTAGLDTGAAPGARSQGAVIVRTTSIGGPGAGLWVRQLDRAGDALSSRRFGASGDLVRAVVGGPRGVLYAVGRRGQQGVVVRLD